MTPGTDAWVVALELAGHPRAARWIWRPTGAVVLGALRRVGRPLSIAELVEVTGRSWPACRRAVAALERTGDVERVAWSERAHGWGAVPMCASPERAELRRYGWAGRGGVGPWVGGSILPWCLSGGGPFRPGSRLDAWAELCAVSS